jgi:hypothetical protein
MSPAIAAPVTPRKSASAPVRNSPAMGVRGCRKARSSLSGVKGIP